MTQTCLLFLTDIHCAKLGCLETAIDEDNKPVQNSSLCNKTFPIQHIAISDIVCLNSDLAITLKRP